MELLEVNPTPLWRLPMTRSPQVFNSQGHLNLRQFFNASSGFPTPAWFLLKRLYSSERCLPIFTYLSNLEGSSLSVSSYRSKKNCWLFSLVSFYLLLGSSGDFQAPYMWNQKLGGHSFHSLHYKSTRTYSLQILARETWWVLRNLTKIWHSPGHPEAPPKLEASLPAQLHRKGGKTDSWGGQMPRRDRCQVFLNDFNWRLKPSKP